MIMRKNIVIIILFLSNLTIYGQATITRDNYFYLGKSYAYLFLDSISKDTALITGNNIVWDFSDSFQGNPLYNTHGIDPSTTIFYNDPNTNYNLSDLCLFEPTGMFSPFDDNMYSYFIIGISSINFIGNWADNGVWEVWYYHLSDPEQYYTFPFSFGNAAQDTFEGVSFDLSENGLHKYDGTRTLEADGYGLLLLPGISYPNCLRVKSIRNYNDSSMFGINNYTKIYYTWFQLNRNGPILEMEINTNPFVQAKYYYNNPLVGTIELNNEVDFLLSPNPFNNTLSVSGNNLNTEIIIYDIFSRKIIQSKFKNSIDFNTEHFPNGIYIYEVRNMNGIIKKGKI